jgi:hypothetical protein
VGPGDGLFVPAGSPHQVTNLLLYCFIALLLYCFTGTLLTAALLLPLLLARRIRSRTCCFTGLLFYLFTGALLTAALL